FDFFAYAYTQGNAPLALGYHRFALSGRVLIIGIFNVFTEYLPYQSRNLLILKEIFTI
ncbi:unnamed protein product, partial [marine sediment metagenome]